MSLYTTSQICMPCLTDLTLFACSSRVNIEEHTFYFAITLLLAVTRGRLPRIQIPTMLSNSVSLNTSLREVIISATNRHGVICDLSNLTLQIIFNALWPSMNVSSQHPIASTESTHTPSRWFHLLCGLSETCIPGIKCIVCHQVIRHPSEPGTSLIWKHLVAIDHIAKLNK